MCFQSIKGLTGNINNIHFNFLTVTKMFHTFGPVIYKTENGTCQKTFMAYLLTAEFRFHNRKLYITILHDISVENNNTQRHFKLNSFPYCTLQYRYIVNSIEN
jgi:hypothetical protein